MIRADKSGESAEAVSSTATFAVDDLRCRIVPIDDDIASLSDPDQTELARVQLLGRSYRILQHGIDSVREAIGSDHDPTLLLTAREREIVRLVCHGQVNKRIADRLRISEYTVKTYMKQIFMKLGVHSRAAMVFRCARHVLDTER